MSILVFWGVSRRQVRIWTGLEPVWKLYTLASVLVNVFVGAWALRGGGVRWGAPATLRSFFVVLFSASFGVVKVRWGHTGWPYPPHSCLICPVVVLCRGSCLFGWAMIDSLLFSLGMLFCFGVLWFLQEPLCNQKKRFVYFLLFTFCLTFVCMLSHHLSSSSFVSWPLFRCLGSICSWFSLLCLNEAAKIEVGSIGP